MQIRTSLLLSLAAVVSFSLGCATNTTAPQATAPTATPSPPVVAEQGSAQPAPEAAIAEAPTAALPEIAVSVPSNVVPFVQTEAGLINVPVRVGDIDTRFDIDTGIGITLISHKLCAALKCAIDGKYSAKRVTGEVVEVQLARIETLSFGGVIKRNFEVGVVDSPTMFTDAQTTGSLALGFFVETPVTISYATHTITVETPETIAARLSVGAVAPLRLVRDGPALSARIEMRLPNDLKASLDIDTSSAALLLDDRYLKDLGIPALPPGAPQPAVVDASGTASTRRTVRLSSPISPADTKLMIEGQDVTFQDVVHDGALGTSFIALFDTTIELSSSRLIFARPVTNK